MKKTEELAAEIIGHVSAILILRDCGVTDYDKILDKIKPLVAEYDAELASNHCHNWQATNGSEVK